MANRPINFNDPMGHKACGDDEDRECGHESQIIPIPIPTTTTTQPAPDLDLGSHNNPNYFGFGDTFNFVIDDFSFCPNGQKVCKMRPAPMTISHWDWSRIDWKTTGIDVVSTIASAANLKWASDGLIKVGKLTNFISTGNTFANEMNRRDDHVFESLFTPTVALSAASYFPIYGIFASGMSVVNDISGGYWEEVIPEYGLLPSNEVR